MNKISVGNKVLFVWKTPLNANDLKSVIDAANSTVGPTGEVKVENLDRINVSSFEKSSLNLIASCWVTPHLGTHNSELLIKYLSLLKTGGILVLRETVASGSNGSNLKSALILNGFSSVVLSEPDSNNVVEITAQKPDFETGSSVSLKIGNKVSEQVASLWKLDNTVDDDLIDADDLLNEDDLKKPAPESLRVCGTTGKRKACKDCSCGLAEELAGDEKPAKTSSCGSCYLGDAFRCSSCPYLGMPAFKPGEKIVLADSQLRSDV